jgi:hypothetical protein
MMGLSVRKNFSVPQPDLYLIHSWGPSVVPVGTGMGDYESAFLSLTKETQ